MSQHDEGFSHAANLASRSHFKFARQFSEPAHKTAKPLKPILKKSRTEPAKRLSALIAAHFPSRRKADVPPVPGSRPEYPVKTRDSVGAARGRIPLRPRDSIHVARRHPSGTRHSSSTSVHSVPEGERELIWSPGWSKSNPEVGLPESTERSNKRRKKPLLPVPLPEEPVPDLPAQRSRSRKAVIREQQSTIPFPSRESFTFLPPRRNVSQAKSLKSAMKARRRSRLESSVQTNWKDSFEADTSQFFNQKSGEVRHARSLSRGSTSAGDMPKRSPSHTSAPRKKRRVSFTTPDGHREQPPVIVRRPTPYSLPLHSKLAKLLGLVVNIFRRKEPGELEEEREWKEKMLRDKKIKKEIEVLEHSFRRLGVSAH